MTIAVIGPLDDRGVEEIGERLSELAGSVRVHLALVIRDLAEVPDRVLELPRLLLLVVALSSIAFTSSAKESNSLFGTAVMLATGSTTTIST